LVVVSVVAGVFPGVLSRGATIVYFDTSLGGFNVQLFNNTMPVTVQNFMKYVNSDRYDGTVIHRNSDSLGQDFVIQGGGFRLTDPDPPDPSAVMSQSSVVTDPPINDEPGGGVAGPSNLRGTIAMAKSGPNTVTSQFFFNQADNTFLDSPARGDGGFSAFGKVLGNGMAVVDAIGDLPIPSDFGFSIAEPFNDLPLRNFTGTAINDVRVANTVTVRFVAQRTPRFGDFDLDGDVDQVDLDQLLMNLGTTTGMFWDDGDADMDGDVDGDDLLIWQHGFTGGPSSTAALSAIPEPTAGVLLAIGVLGLIARRREAPSRELVARRGNPGPPGRGLDAFPFHHDPPPDFQREQHPQPQAIAAIARLEVVIQQVLDHSRIEDPGAFHMPRTEHMPGVAA
jgi:cyclophilin family peptidyl-prolyl cis-trans isomerase